jgi:hypothetical protein
VDEILVNDNAARWLPAENNLSRSHPDGHIRVPGLLKELLYAIAHACDQKGEESPSFFLLPIVTSEVTQNKESVNEDYLSSFHCTPEDCVPSIVYCHTS